MECYSIIHGLDSLYAVKADTDWLAFNLKVITEFKRISKNEDELRQLLKSHQFEDIHWSWINKSVALSTPEYEWFYFLVEDQVQGICNIFHPKPSRIDDQDIFYVEYVAVAPWNRGTLLAAKRFKGVGSVLIKIALTYSMEILGYRPGFSLHSLPQAITYYEKIGMKNFGPDNMKQNLHYLEMEREKSKRFAYA